MNKKVIICFSLLSIMFKINALEIKSFSIIITETKEYYKLESLLLKNYDTNCINFLFEETSDTTLIIAYSNIDSEFLYPVEHSFLNYLIESGDLCCDYTIKCKDVEKVLSVIARNLDSSQKIFFEFSSKQIIFWKKNEEIHAVVKVFFLKKGDHSQEVWREFLFKTDFPYCNQGKYFYRVNVTKGKLY